MQHKLPIVSGWVLTADDGSVTDEIQATKAGQSRSDHSGTLLLLLQAEGGRNTSQKLPGIRDHKLDLCSSKKDTPSFPHSDGMQQHRSAQKASDWLSTSGDEQEGWFPSSGGVYQTGNALPEVAECRVKVHVRTSHESSVPSVWFLIISSKTCMSLWANTWAKNAKKQTKKQPIGLFAGTAWKKDNFFRGLLHKRWFFELFIPNPSSSSLLDLAHEECKQQQVSSSGAADLVPWAAKPHCGDGTRLLLLASVLALNPALGVTRVVQEAHNKTPPAAKCQRKNVLPGFTGSKPGSYIPSCKSSAAFARLPAVLIGWYPVSVLKHPFTHPWIGGVGPIFWVNVSWTDHFTAWWTVTVKHPGSLSTDVQANKTSQK